MKWKESKEEIKEMGKKSKHSYRYDLVKRGGNVRGFLLTAIMILV